MNLFLMLAVYAGSLFGQINTSVDSGYEGLLEILLCAALILLFIFAYKIRLLQNERERERLKNEADSKIMFLKSRYASLGETVGNIAHQWKQPLNAISTIQTGIKASLIYQGEISKEKLLHSVETSFKLLQHLAETIDTFYSFLTHQHSSRFKIADELETIRKITEYSFDNSNIKLIFELHVNPEIEGNANEFTHAMLNLILNAKDAFDNAETDSPTITVHIMGGEETCTISVSDNAGGIRMILIDSIFDWHISSKEKGSGLGLYMTKNIIEKRFGGTIKVENKNGGAHFTVKIPYNECTDYFADTIAPDEQKSLEHIKQLTEKIIELEELEKTLKKWADIFRQARWGIALHVGTSNSFELTNAAFNALYGYTPQELRNISVPDLFVPEALSILSHAQKEAFEKGYVIFETVHKRKDGSTFPASIELIIIKDENGEILYHIANIWDLTEKKEAEDRLLLKKFALDQIKDAVFLIDETARFHYVNEGACAALGYTQEEFECMNVGDVDPDWPSERWSEHWNTLKEVGSMTMELLHRRKDGTLFPVEVSANYIQFGDKHYNMAIARDITERLRLDAQKDNERMRLFFERQLVGMAITSPEKGWIHTNEKLQEMLGYTHEELTQLTWVEMTYAEDLAPDVEQFERLLRAEIEDYMLEKRFIRKDGTIVYTNLAVSCVRNDDHSVNYVLALLEDITERKELEALLEKERKFLIDAQRVAHTGSWYLDIPNSVLSWSDETYRIFELDKEHIDDLHTTFYERVHPDDREMVNAPYVESLKTKLPYQVEHRIVMEDGRIKYVIERCEHIYDNDGTPLYSIGTVQDITEQKMMEKKIEDSYHFLYQLIDSIPDPIFVKDKQHTWVLLNQAFCDFIGHPREMLLDKSDYDFFPKEEADVFWEKDERVYQSGEINVNEEFFTSNDGVTHYIQTVKSMFVSGNGESHLVGTIRDMSERKRVEEAIKHLNETLEKRVLERTAQLQEAVTNLHKEISEKSVLQQERFVLEERLSKIAATVPGVNYIFEKTADGKVRFTYVAPTFEELFGISVNEALGDFLIVMEYIHPDDREAIRQSIVDTACDLTNWHEEFRVLHPRKGVVWIEGQSSPEVQPDGSILWYGFFHDATERKDAEKALSESEQRYREIFENSSDSIYLMEVTENGRFRTIAANPAFEHSIGIPIDTLLGTYVGDLTDEETTATVIAKYRRCVEAAEPIEEIAELDLPVGRKKFCSTLIPIKDETGRVCRIIGLAKDITENKT